MTAGDRLVRRESLFVYRPLRNATDLLRWARGARLRRLIKAQDLHVTLARACPRGIRLARPDDLLVVPAGGRRSLLIFGEDLVALTFASPELERRALQLRAQTGEGPEYQGPHVSFGLGGLGAGSFVAPYQGPLIFGPETARPAWPS